MESASECRIRACLGLGVKRSWLIATANERPTTIDQTGRKMTSTIRPTATLTLREATRAQGACADRQGVTPLPLECTAVFIGMGTPDNLRGRKS